MAMLSDPRARRATFGAATAPIVEQMRRKKGGMVMEVEAEVSLYPLGQKELEPGVKAFIKALREHGCQVEVGDMSSIVAGESQTVFEALRLAYDSAASEGGCVLIVKACNVCPV